MNPDLNANGPGGVCKCFNDMYYDVGTVTGFLPPIACHGSGGVEYYHSHAGKWGMRSVTCSGTEVKNFYSQECLKWFTKGEDYETEEQKKKIESLSFSTPDFWKYLMEYRPIDIDLANASYSLLLVNPE